ncbi:uncharacterized protein MEPE_05311 [Melanopsichium pennsylvanicum]|uniref:Uncharacterized protein n=1 Tax=Melanopsichium pennsylvanicum TaxID=63383 RepID=A0AAJ4XQK7_9BASI|nr:uncharacterized protein MEPE_05311 [Melanopsichium pennsylvanicum]
MTMHSPSNVQNRHTIAQPEKADQHASEVMRDWRFDQARAVCVMRELEAKAEQSVGGGVASHHEFSASTDVVNVPTRELQVRELRWAVSTALSFPTKVSGWRAVGRAGCKWLELRKGTLAKGTIKIASNQAWVQERRETERQRPQPPDGAMQGEAGQSGAQFIERFSPPADS